jgi:hypothetical protein
MPKAGDIEEGYRFKGGDPGKAENWEKVVERSVATPSPHSLPMQAAITAIGAPRRAFEALKPVGEFAKPSIAPTLGSIALPAAATAIAGPANLPFVPLEQAAGGAAGLGINKLLGISDPSAVDFALSAGLPLAAGVGSNVIRAVKQFAPLGKAAETMQPLAHQEAIKRVTFLRGTENVKQLFGEATKQGVRVPLAKTAEMVQQISDEVASATPAGKQAWQGILKQTGLDDLVTAPTGTTPAQLQNVLADVGKLQSKAAREGGLKADKLGKLFSALSDDLDQVPALAHARSVFKRERVLDEIHEAIAGAFRLNQGQTVEKFSPNKIVNALQDKSGSLGKFFSQAFSKGEQKETIEFFKFLNTIPGLSPPVNVQAGSLKFMREVLVGGGFGAGIGHLFGIPPQVAGPVGAAIGVGGTQAVNVGKTMLQAWKMEGGKQLIKSLLKNSDGALTPQVMGAIGAFISGQLATPAPQQSNVIQPPTGLPAAFPMQR